MKRNLNGKMKMSPGLTIIEVMIAGAILLVLMLAMMDVSMLGFKSEKTATTKTLLTVLRNQAESVLSPLGCSANFASARAGTFDPSLTTSTQSVTSGFSINYVANATTVPPTLSNTKVVGVGDKVGTWEVTAIQVFFRGVVDAAAFKYNADVILKAEEKGGTKGFGTQARELVIPAVFTMDGASAGASVVACSAIKGETSGTGGGEIPKGAVMAFDSADCPEGWTKMSGLAGRTIVGAGGYTNPSDELPSHDYVWKSETEGGTTGGKANQKLLPEEAPIHSHGLVLPTENVSTFVASNSTSAALKAPLPAQFLTSCDLGDPSDPNRSVPVNCGLRDGPGFSAPGRAFDNRAPYYVLTYCKKN